MTAALQHVCRPTGRRLAILAALSAVVLAALLSLGAGPAAAVEPRNLADQLTDGANVLSAAEEAEVRDALAALQDATDVQLWAWYTTTTSGQEIVDFAAETAKMSSLGGTDLLLVIALDDRAYGFSSPAGFPLSDPEIEQLLSRALEPGLRDEDYAGAIVAVAEALDAGLSATPAPVETDRPSVTPPGGEGGAAGGGGIGTIVMVIVVVVLVAGVGWFFFVRRRFGAAVGVPGGRGGGPGTPGGPVDPYAGLSDDDLNAEANRLLLTTDDAVRDSEQELGFAQAQFGEAAAAAFGAAIAAAKEDLRAAFQVRQQLDDATPEDRPTRRRMLGDLIGRCRVAQDRLDKEADRFEELRAFEREAPAVLAGLPPAADAVEARIPAVEATMAQLQDYADAAWQAVAPNLDEARARLAAARAAVTEGEAAAAVGDTARVAAAARVGQEAVGQAAAFLDAIERLSAELDEARDKVSAEIADAEADLARAKAAAAASSGDPGLPGRLAEVEALLASARQEIGVPKPDVAAAYAKARRANEIADEVLAGIRTAAEQRAALAARLETSIR
ncbi:MAG TPA: TPM domain-containing protein, partial [Candidatus Nanopelagicales bacterium]|nr:TPM domain-containing protein [Candidatus Nanopelagicales bacterium]